MSSVCVHGLGYIGLPTAAMLANCGYKVYGYDADQEVTEQLSKGNVHIDEPKLYSQVTQARESKQLEIIDEIVPADYHIICVPTPFDAEEKQAQLEYIESSGRGIAPNLRNGDTVILESTVPPGTTKNVLQPILEESKLDAGSDFALAHCPETVLPGNMISELRENNRIIGGVNTVSTKAATRLYDSFVQGEIRTTDDATTAEFVKLIQNTFRDANIAVANEVAKVAADYNVDSREAISLANEHPRVNLLQPGPGVGGHCLPIDPWFLGQSSNSLNLIEKAREVNNSMVNYVVDLIHDEIGSFSGKQIAILGVAYKGNVGDIRNSPTLEVVDEIQKKGHQSDGITTDGGTASEERAMVDLRLHDPHVENQGLNLVDLEEAVTGADAAVIMTDHDEFRNLDPTWLSNHMKNKIVIDTRGILPVREWEQDNYTVKSI